MIDSSGYFMWRILAAFACVQCKFADFKGLGLCWLEIDVYDDATRVTLSPKPEPTLCPCRAGWVAGIQSCMQEKGLCRLFSGRGRCLLGPTMWGSR